MLKNAFMSILLAQIGIKKPALGGLQLLGQRLRNIEDVDEQRMTARKELLFNAAQQNAALAVALLW
jgi:hypothetical protein